MKKYFYADDSVKEGPFSLEEIKNKNIKEETLIWFEGLNDWTQAKYVIELHEIFELRPPPIIKGEIKKTKQKIIQVGLKEPSQIWIFLGFIFALLGGFIGIGMGFHYAFGKYDQSTKTTGWIMAVIGMISLSIWKSI